MEEKRKSKKRQEAGQILNKYPGLSFNPEIELKKWEIHEQQKQQMIEVNVKRESHLCANNGVALP